MAIHYGEGVVGKKGRFARIKKLPTYSCSSCGHHIHPMAGTPLQKWFYAMYLLTTTSNGVAAKKLQRQLVVTHKCAWRIGLEIRKHMAQTDSDSPLDGQPIVEADETFVDGYTPGGRGGKTIVFGVVERGSDVIARMVPNRGEFTLVPHILQNVRRGTRIATDEHRSYSKFPEEGYHPATVNHSAKEYVNGLVHANTIKGFWSWMKRQISGTHVWGSQKNLPKYLGEMEFCFNLLKRPEPMFETLLMAFQKPYRP